MGLYVVGRGKRTWKSNRLYRETLVFFGFVFLFFLNQELMGMTSQKEVWKCIFLLAFKSRIDSSQSSLSDAGTL